VDSGGDIALRMKEFSQSTMLQKKVKIIETVFTLLYNNTLSNLKLRRRNIP
jgi:hypothetical protein